MLVATHTFEPLYLTRFRLIYQNKMTALLSYTVISAMILLLLLWALSLEEEGESGIDAPFWFRRSRQAHLWTPR